MGGQGCLRPIAQGTLRSTGNKLPRAFANQPNYLRTRFTIEALRRQNLRDLFAKLAIALQRFLDVLPDCSGHTSLQGRAVSSSSRWQRLLQSRFDRVTHAAFQIVVGRFFKRSVRGELRLLRRIIALLCTVSRLR
jgi:hypothetical protein